MPFKKGVTPPGAKPFVKGQSGNPGGKPKSSIKAINEELRKDGYPKANKYEIVDCFSIMLNLPMSKVKEIADPTNDNYPIIYKLVAKEIIGKNGGDMLDKILDRAYGKAMQQIEHNGISMPQITLVTPSDADECSG